MGIPRNPLPNPLLVFSPLRTALVVGVGAVAAGILTLASSSSTRALIAGIGFLLGGAIFLGMGVALYVSLRRSARA